MYKESVKSALIISIIAWLVSVLFFPTPLVYLIFAISPSPISFLQAYLIVVVFSSPFALIGIAGEVEKASKA